MYLNGSVIRSIFLVFGFKIWFSDRATLDHVFHKQILGTFASVDTFIPNKNLDDAYDEI